MNKIFKHIALGVALSVAFVSCDDEREVPTTGIGGYAYLSETSISSFDENANLDIKLITKDGVTFNSIEVSTETASEMATIASDELATVNTAFLGTLSEDAYEVFISSELSNGKMAGDYFTISVDNPISISEDNLAEATLDTLPNVEVAYELFTNTASIDDVMLSLKKNSDGIYADSGATGLSTVDGGSVLLSDTNYQALNLVVNDTLYYKFTATSGSLSADAEGQMVIIEED